MNPVNEKLYNTLRKAGQMCGTDVMGIIQMVDSSIRELRRDFPNNLDYIDLEEKWQKDRPALVNEWLEKDLKI